MPTKDDRRAGLVLLGLTGIGLVVRLVLGGGAEPGAVLYEPAVPEDTLSRDSLAEQASRLARPLQKGEKIDLDRASAQELTRLPRIGPVLAVRIVEYRDARGPFGSLAQLDSVPGIGPMVLESIRDHVSLSSVERTRARNAPRTGRLVMLRTATAEQLAQLPGIGPARAKAIVDERRRNGPYKSVDGLTRVSGIGPATIERIRRFVVP